MNPESSPFSPGQPVPIEFFVGRKLLEPQVFQVLRRDRYRSILRKMADRLVGRQFRRKDLLAQTHA